MPKDPRAAKVSKQFWKTASEKFATQMPEIVAEHYVPVDNTQETRLDHHYPEGKFGDVRHVGMRRHVQVPEDMRWKPEWDDEESA